MLEALALTVVNVGGHYDHTLWFRTRFSAGDRRDARSKGVEWALEEIGLPYRVHGLDHTGGEHDGPAYSKISPFHLVPVIDDLTTIGSCK